MLTFPSLTKPSLYPCSYWLSPVSKSSNFVAHGRLSVILNKNIETYIFNNLTTPPGKKMSMYNVQI